MPEPSWFWPWVAWRERNKKGPRPADAPAKIPAEEWVDLKTWCARHRHPTPPLSPPPPTPPPPPPPPADPPSFKTKGPVVFTAWDASQARQGPWQVLQIAVPGIAPEWTVPGHDTIVAQAEATDQVATALGFFGNYGHTAASTALVATQGGWMPADPFLQAGVNTCFAEAYQVDDPTHTPNQIAWQAHHDGWPYVWPVAGCYHGYPLSSYDLSAFGTNFGVWLAEEMTDDDWKTLANLAH